MFLLNFVFLSVILRCLPSTCCTNSQVLYGKKLDVQPYIEETTSDLMECYKRCREDGKCISVNFSKSKSLCQKLRRNHQQPKAVTLKNDSDWTYLVNPANKCNQKNYPCEETELCERRGKPDEKNFFCTHMLFGIPSR